MICLKIDYRDATIQWWDWEEGDKEETVFNLTGDKVLYKFYKIEKNIFAIYKTLITDMFANKDILYDTKNHTILYGDKFILDIDAKTIYVRSIWDKDEFKIYQQSKETGELELINYRRNTHEQNK